MTPPAPSIDNICAAVVTYHPDEQFVSRFAELAQHVARFVVIDNASGEAARARIGTLGGHQVDWIWNEQNLGVATALNQAARHALEHGFSWLLMFDQDTIPAPHMIDGLIAIHAMVSRSAKVGTIGSNFRLGTSSDLFISCRSTALPYVERETIITSGSILSLDAFTRAGAFRDDFFIDGVDSEYCLRLRRCGYGVYASCAPLMEHSLGEVRPERFLWMTLFASHHSALRRYYITRNALVISREYGRTEARWVGESLRAVRHGLAGVLLFEKHKLRKLAATFAGAIDALLGRMGRCAHAWLSR